MNIYGNNRKTAFTLAESVTHVAISHNTRRVAFTLAEVLITLGILGIVSAMTIPTLVQKNTERAWDKSSLVFERKLSESLKVMNTQQTLAGHTTTASFVNELSKHFKIVKICNNNELLNCFNDTVLWGGGEATQEEVDMAPIRLAKNLGQKDWNTSIVGVQFANGVSSLIAYNPNCKQDPYSNQVTGTSCLAILYDTTGKKSPNANGKDLRSINVASLGSGCAFKVGSTCYTTAPFLPEQVTRAECEQIKNSLGIKHCDADHGPDTWVGAVKACGHVSKLPTMEQLTELAKYIYNNDDIYLVRPDPDGYSNDIIINLNRDPSKLASLGFNFGDTQFSLLSKEELTPLEVNFRIYDVDYTMSGNWNRINPDHYAVCIE